MDTSEQYIKMCDCPEIQEQWKPEKGDWYQLGIKIDRSPSICILGCHWNKCSGCRAEVESLKKECIWLPRQDQIQKIMKYLSLWELMYGFWKYIQDLNYLGTKPDEYLIKNFNSMEQLWLAFYMKEKHNKVWDGENWKINKR